MARIAITMDEAVLVKARRKAKRLGIRLSGYLTNLVNEDNKAVGRRKREPKQEELLRLCQRAEETFGKREATDWCRDLVEFGTFDEAHEAVAKSLFLQANFEKHMGGE